MGAGVVNGPIRRCRGRQARPGFGLQVEKMRELVRGRGKDWGVGRCEIRFSPYT